MGIRNTGKGISVLERYQAVSYTHLAFKKVVKDEKNEVFSEDEIPVIVDYLKKNVTIWNLGVLLVLQTGVRVGELSALKPCDWDGKDVYKRQGEGRN